MAPIAVCFWKVRCVCVWAGCSIVVGSLYTATPVVKVFVFAPCSMVCF